MRGAPRTLRMPRYRSIARWYVLDRTDGESQSPEQCSESTSPPARGACSRQRRRRPPADSRLPPPPPRTRRVRRHSACHSGIARMRARSPAAPWPPCAVGVGPPWPSQHSHDNTNTQPPEPQRMHAEQVRRVAVSSDSIVHTRSRRTHSRLMSHNSRQESGPKRPRDSLSARERAVVAAPRTQAGTEWLAGRTVTQAACHECRREQSPPRGLTHAPCVPRDG